MHPLPADTKSYFLRVAEGDRSAFKVIFDLYIIPLKYKPRLPPASMAMKNIVQMQ